jgi:ADP-heptose:LPS heptosyltransferase
MKIIILKRDKLGDLLLTTPMLQLLKYFFPEAKLAVIAPESSAWILKDAPFIDELYSYPKPKSFNFKGIIALIKQVNIFLKQAHSFFILTLCAPKKTSGNTLAVSARAAGASPAVGLA